MRFFKSVLPHSPTKIARDSARMEEDRPTARGQDNEEDEEDALPDWTTFAKFAKSVTDALPRRADTLDRCRTLNKGTADVPSIPRRGEKGFSPLPATNILNSTEEARTLSAYQLATLANSRAALFSALSSGTRSHSSKSHNSFTWRPEISRATIDNTATYGIHFSSIGLYNSERKRLELLPEEALYLFERGIIELHSETVDEGATNREFWTPGQKEKQFDAECWWMDAWRIVLGGDNAGESSQNSSDDAHRSRSIAGRVFCIDDLRWRRRRQDQSWRRITAEIGIWQDEISRREFVESLREVLGGRKSNLPYFS